MLWILWIYLWGQESDIGGSLCNSRWGKSGQLSEVIDKSLYLKGDEEAKENKEIKRLKIIQKGEERNLIGDKSGVTVNKENEKEECKKLEKTF